MKSVGQRFLLVGIQSRKTSDAAAYSSWRELWQLVESYGGQVVDTVIQRREIHDKGMYLGSGKLAEVQQLVIKEDIDVVALHDAVKPGQLYGMQIQLAQAKADLEVWDRIDLILHIFSQHAHTAEARLQIELASMRHMGPRIYGMGLEMSRQGGGIGTRGIGETNTERMKRHWASQIHKAEETLAKLAGSRERQLDRRRRLGLKTVSIIGYTNAGKTSLYNRLVGKQKFTRDLLFATLDASVGSVYLPQHQTTILLSDTIGFIDGLPPELLQAFTSTLMESMYADLLLQVIDASDPDYKAKLRVVESVIGYLGLNDRQRMYVFNKMDVASVSKDQLKKEYLAYCPQFVSSLTGSGLGRLLAELEKALKKG